MGIDFVSFENRFEIMDISLFSVVVLCRGPKMLMTTSSRAAAVVKGEGSTCAEFDIHSEPLREIGAQFCIHPFPVQKKGSCILSYKRHFLECPASVGNQEKYKIQAGDVRETTSWRALSSCAVILKMLWQS